MTTQIIKMTNTDLNLKCLGGRPDLKHNRGYMALVNGGAVYNKRFSYEFKTPYLAVKAIKKHIKHLAHLEEENKADFLADII